MRDRIEWVIVTPAIPNSRRVSLMRMHAKSLAGPASQIRMTHIRITV